ncbi:DUF2171 domain-containing protein [Sphingomonas alba]|uniref:DUF2171 domain-containing protein n=1 Tax=Sphingomonas alba TaxID=2908208 RepID=A0ABT0RQ60_9SPHN|nr:DUF2171 domain-containing protein [Sphingomonas alba]MCL6684419.1 DUF2171 domain-containing protein [Sphingomonas alba]
MAYDRYDTRRDWRGERSRWQGDDRSDRSWGNDRDRNERGWFDRASDEVASWFGDDDAERRRRQDNRMSGWSGNDRDRHGSGHLRNDDDVRSYYSHRDHDRDAFGRDRDTSFRRDRDFGRDDRAFMSDEDFSRYERRPSFRDEGYRRPYTGRFTGRDDRDRDDRGYRPMTGDYGRGTEERMEQGASFYGVGAHHDRHYGEWRSKQIDQLDRDYEDYARENRSRFEDDFSNWRGKRQEKRGLLGQVREHMEVLGSDGEHVGTVDRTAGDRLILAKSDPESGGAHHSLMCTMIDRIEGNQLFLDTPADEAKKRWRDDSRERALFERDDQGEAGPHALNRSFSGTY